MTISRHALLLASLATVMPLGCGHDPRGRVRFANAPIAWRVNDRRDVPEKPKKNRFDHMVYVFDGTAHKPLDDVLAVKEPRRAANVNALGEVPSSTWFTNRIGVRTLSLEQMRRGPNTDDGPDRSGPWRVLGTKQGRAAPGVLMEDARGVRFLLKFDPTSRPEMEGGAEVVVQRLLWAAGYHVPENTVVYFTRDRLVVAEDAVKELETGKEAPMTSVDMDALLAEVEPDEDGRYRGLASKFLPGEPLGGFVQERTRSDDPNDLVPHEHRRDLRGLYVFAAWLGHSDMKEDNTVDMWIEDPERPGRHYVRHHLVDFGKALGVMGWTGREKRDGYAHNYDYAFILGSALTFGIWKRPWESLERPPIRGVGMFGSEHFHPNRFKSRNRFVPFRRKDRFDAFWATKILMRFTPELIRTAVEQGRYTDPAAVDYLTRTLVERQRETGRYWLSRVNPLDAFTVEAEGGAYRVCARDLLLQYRLDPKAVTSTSYELRAYGFDGRPLSWKREIPAPATGHVCAEGLRPAVGHEHYTIVGFITHRGKKELDPVWLHLAEAPETGRLRVIGIDRQ